jgi:hypothetical protein
VSDGGVAALGDPWVFLEQGTTVNVSLAWSGEFINSLHFVRVDMNPANPGERQVGGAAYGNTEASARRCRATGRTSPMPMAARTSAISANTFGFEDNTAPRGADFDYNDMTMKLGIGEWFV